MALDIQITGLNTTSELDKYIRSKLRPISRRIKNGVCMVELGHGNSCKITLKTIQKTYIAEEVTEHIYASVDVAVADIRCQLPTPPTTWLLP